jgi:transposase
MKLYGAIDLHSTDNVTVVINEQDQVVYQKRFPNDLSLIAQQLSSYRASLESIVVESTYNWYWLVDGLIDVNDLWVNATSVCIDRSQSRADISR